MGFILLILGLFLYLGVGGVLGALWFSEISWLDFDDEDITLIIHITGWPVILATLVILKLFSIFWKLVCRVGRIIYKGIIKIVLLFY